MTETQPVADSPAGFAGVPMTALTWPAARTRLADHETYLLSTVRPDGRPHVVPLPSVVFAFGKERGFSATRWRWPPARPDRSDHP